MYNLEMKCYKLYQLSQQGTPGDIFKTYMGTIPWISSSILLLVLTVLYYAHLVVQVSYLGFPGAYCTQLACWYSIVNYDWSKTWQTHSKCLRMFIENLLFHGVHKNFCFISFYLWLHYFLMLALLCHMEQCRHILFSNKSIIS